ncbi:MAG: SGNH/GDSL hydrolase family protein [Acidimicrobiales bacterium]
MTFARRAAVVLGVPALVVGVLGVEVLIARNGPEPEEPPGGVGVTFEAAPGPVTLWLGDSTAAGVGVSSTADALPLQVAALESEEGSLVVLAVSGDTIEDAVRDQLSQLQGIAVGRVARVFISIGANDVTHLTSVGSFRSTYRDLIGGLRSRLGHEVPIVMLGVPDMGAPPRLAQPLRAVAGWRGRRLDREVRAIASEASNATYVPIAATTGPAFRDDTDRYFAADDYHPSAEGYGLWARAVVDTLGR